jgi:hypothetical protein
MNRNNQDECIEGFHCVDFFRKIKDEISAKLNAMTLEEELAYYDRINKKYCEREAAK